MSRDAASSGATNCKMPAQRRTVAIVGGGPAGASVAITLAQRGVNTTVLEAQPEAETKIGECLPPDANRLLEQLGIKDRLDRENHLVFYGNRSWWGSSAPVERDFLFGTNGSGWQLNRRKFTETLCQVAIEQGAKWRYGCRLVQCHREGSGWLLRVKSAHGIESLEADFVVDASGRRAALARQLGARVIRYDRLIGAVVIMRSATGVGLSDSFTLLEAVASGWWYAAPLPDNQLIISYMTDSDLVDHQTLRRLDNFLALLDQAEHIRSVAGNGSYHPLTEPQILAANSARLDSIASEGWLAVGDAATAYDPLASYGIAAALGGGCNAAAAIADCFAGNQNAISQYRNVMDQAFALYRQMLHEYYSLEQRWPDELFWQRRQRR